MMPYLRPGEDESALTEDQRRWAKSFVEQVRKHEKECDNRKFNTLTSFAVLQLSSGRACAMALMYPVCDKDKLLTVAGYLVIAIAHQQWL